MTAHIPVFLASDDRYAPFVATTIASVCFNTKSFIDFYILDGGITPFHQRMILALQDKFPKFSVEFLAIDADAVFKRYPAQPGIALSTYSRFLISELKPELDRALYSDVDVIALGDIAEMFEQNLAGHVIGAVCHAYFDKNKYVEQGIRHRMGLSPLHKYFYAGNLLIDCEKWRKEKVTKKLFDIAERYAATASAADQDILNKCFDNNNYQQLDYKFCLTSRNCDYFFRANKAEYKRISHSAIIRHFETRSKPWLTDVFYEGHPLENFDDFWFFAAMTPFYPGLQQGFIASRARNEVFLREIMGNINKPDKNVLADLRTRVATARHKQ
jgi:lipopolysaccharide biosynthesis glycosyltransferase